MPEYLAPGVFIEEVSYRAKSIEGVSTTTTGFIGPTRFGPTDIEPELLTSLVEYERIYGDRQPLCPVPSSRPGLVQAGDLLPNFMWHAVRAFFENGGKRLYVQRVFEKLGGSADPAEGCAFHTLEAQTTPLKIAVKSRFPGAAGRRRVRIALALGPNTLVWAPDNPAAPSHQADPVIVSPSTGHGEFQQLNHLDVVWIDRASVGSPPESPPASPPAFNPGFTAGFYLATKTDTADGVRWSFSNGRQSPPETIPAHSLTVDPFQADKTDRVRVVSASVTVFDPDPEAPPAVWGSLALDPGHRRFEIDDSLFHQFAPLPEDRAWRRSIPVVITPDLPDGAPDPNGLDVLDLLLAQAPGIRTALPSATATPADRAFDILLDHGNDGVRPTAKSYEGDQINLDDTSGLKAFEDLEDISIVAAPGSTYLFDKTDARWRDQASTVIQLLIAHAERMRYRIAVLDSGDDQSIAQVRAMRAALDSKHAAMYYPWVRALDPVSQQPIALPPSGFVAGIFARNDVQRAVHKAPANEVVTLALGFEKTLNSSQQGVLNPEGVNCFRYFEGRGNRLWGARTISSDPEWKYVNLRRYFAYLERSIDVGTQWAVFESNAPALWANVRRTISDFLFNEFMSGAFIGDKPETSYFVKCDRSTMTQNDIDNGRLVCQIGVAVVKPAEFVIFRIGQWTADAKR
jgi:hypothetical protein